MNTRSRVFCEIAATFVVPGFWGPSAIAGEGQDIVTFSNRAGAESAERGVPVSLRMVSPDKVND